MLQAVPVMDEPMRHGLYEQLATRSLMARLAQEQRRVTTEPVDIADQPHVLARHLYESSVRALAEIRDPGDRVALVNDVLARLAEEDRVTAPPAQLLQLSEAAAPGVVASDEARPRTPLSEAALLTNSRGEPSLGAELRAEIDTSDEVDLLCAFVKWHGLRLLEPQLNRLRSRHAPLRVITTTYMGATERAALDRLVREFGAEVKVQYDAHADAPARQGVDVPPRTPDSTPPMSGRRTSPAPLCWTESSGMFGSRSVATPALLAEVRGDLRHLLERHQLRDLRP